MEKSKELEASIANALEMLSQANNAMINCISQAVKESDVDRITYDEKMDDKAYYRCGYTETRTIGYNEDGNLVMFDDCDNVIAHIEDLSADDLYDICLNFS